jgi:hypothetical protein
VNLALFILNETGTSEVQNIRILRHPKRYSCPLCLDLASIRCSCEINICSIKINYIFASNELSGSLLLTRTVSILVTCNSSSSRKSTILVGKPNCFFFLWKKMVFRSCLGLMDPKNLVRKSCTNARFLFFRLLRSC